MSFKRNLVRRHTTIHLVIVGPTCQKTVRRKIKLAICVASGALMHYNVRICFGCIKIAPILSHALGLRDKTEFNGLHS